MIKVSNIVKKYSHQLILDNISFEIPEYSIAGIIGPNGAGKSTLLKIITGFEYADSGNIYYSEKNLYNLEEKVRFFSYMPEFLKIYPDFYVYEFIKFIENTAKFKNEELIMCLNLKAIFNKRIANLSKGYNQRLKLFFALSNNKPVVVLDEPFDGFDPIQLIDILELIKDENKKGRTFLISIHQLSDAEKICNYFILLNNGKLVAKGTLKELSERAKISNGNLETIFIQLLKKGEDWNK